jgi:hypothetical protein
MKSSIVAHARLLSVLITLAAIVQFLYLKLLEPQVLALLQNRWSMDADSANVVVTLVSSTSIFGGIVAAGLLVYEKGLWHRFLPSSDFHGAWRTTWTYHGSPALGVVGTADITQTWYGDLAMTGTYVGTARSHKDKGCWHSISCKALPNPQAEIDQLIHTYETDHSTGRGSSDLTPSGHESIAGVERLTVVKRDKRGRPVAMAGHFYNYNRHALNGAAPLRSGGSEWCRVQDDKRLEGKSKNRGARRLISMPTVESANR